MTGGSTHDDQARVTAQSLVELAAGVLETDAASVWRYDDERAHLLARHPPARAPAELHFSRMPDVGASIRAGETRVYVRAETSGAVREWMEQAAIEVSLRLPVATPAAPRHFLGLSWETAEHPSVDLLLPIAQRFADHLAVSLRQIASGRLRVESALELSDNVAQALVVAKSSMQLGRHDIAEHAIDRALSEFQAIMQRLRREDHTRGMRRVYPSDVLGERSGSATAPPD